ncbi:hypothetical protein M405DRAFT_845765 [Rhizopogon salebrosus TDB-379]|nr:hypothetical protein M405DRAFT_845765 [Rhizopogon salebrosus TDB-379]
MLKCRLCDASTPWTYLETREMCMSSEFMTAERYLSDMETGYETAEKLISSSCETACNGVLATKRDGAEGKRDSKDESSAEDERDIVLKHGNSDRDDNSSPIPSNEEFAEQQAALVLRREQAMWEMQEAEDRLAKQRRKCKEEKERKCKAQEEKEKCECKAQEEKEKRERQEHERLEKQRMEQGCREEQERVCALEETCKTDAARQKVKDAEVRKYLEDLESEALIKGKIFYRVQKISCQSVGKPSGAMMQARGTLPGIPGERVTLRNNKEQTLMGTRNETHCGQCELGNRACVAPDNAAYAVKQTLVRCIHCVWGHKKCEFPDDSKRVRARDAQACGIEHIAEGWQGQEEGTQMVEDPPAQRRRRPAYGKEHRTIEVDDTAWVAAANNLVVVGGDTLRFLREWGERTREWRDEDRAECEMYRAQAARAESSLQAQVRELRELESSARAERRAAEHAHSEARAELIEIQREMLDVLKELRDQNKDADGLLVAIMAVIPFIPIMTRWPL